MKNICILLLTMFLASCSSAPVIKSESGKSLLVEGRSRSEPLLVKYEVRFISINNKDLKSEKGYPSSLNVEPGSHEVLVSCYSPSPRNPVASNGEESFKHDFKANHTYSFTMKEVALGKCVIFMEESK